MRTRAVDDVLRCLRRAALGNWSDRELLEAFVTCQQEAAFEAILRRHGPMVLAVCERVLGNPHDAEDAFQATFLVLVRKAATVRKREVLGSWLYGVAYRTALKARALSARRRFKEQQAVPPPRPAVGGHDPDLDSELNALPEKYRMPVVLCALEGRSRKEAARLLNIPEGTLSSRLATARKTLARRLCRHDCLFGGDTPSPAVVPSVLLLGTVKAATLVLAGGVATPIVSAQVIALSERVVKAMFVTKLKTLTASLVVLGALAVGAGRINRVPLAEGPAATAQETPPDPRAALQQAAAEVEAARAALKQAEVNLAASKARLAQSEAVYQETLQRRRPDDKETQAARASALAGRFKYRVPFEIGFTETHDGGRIEILEVWGTRPLIEVGGQYLVHGKYTLPSEDKGTLYLHQTADNWDNTGPDLDLQYMAAPKGQGEFTLVHGMPGRGFLHLHLVRTERDKYVTYANVYFGTGDNVWRKK